MKGQVRNPEPSRDLAAPQGFEPRYADPESAVLPLNEGATVSIGFIGAVQVNLAPAPILFALLHAVNLRRETNTAPCSRTIPTQEAAKE